MERTEFSVPEMACGGCERTVENAANDVEGVTRVDADHESGTVEVAGDADPATVRTAIEESGYDVEA
jgi:copper chaperone